MEAREKLKGKVAVVTGGGSGIGKSISHLFAKEGAEVIVVEVNGENGQQTVDEIVNSGGNARLKVVNVTLQGDLVNAFSDEFRIDILVNNAGIAHVGNLEKTSEEDFERIYSVNVKGVYNCLYALVPKMKETKYGAILNLASIASTVGIPDRFAYSMSKGAVLSMTLSVARDYIDYGIRCNCISPGRVHTPFVDGFIAKNYPGQEKEMFEKLAKTQPIGRMGTPDEIAKLALFLCSDDAAFITGCNYAIDGGFISLK